MKKSLGILAAVLLSVVLAACYSPPAAAPGSAPGPGAPSLSVVSPAEGASISGGEVKVSVNTENFTIKGGGGANKPNEGHVHMKVDGGAVSMAYGDSHSFSGVPAGKHTLEVELVNNDHSSLNPP